MAYMKDSTGRRLDTFAVPSKNRSIARSLTRHQPTLPQVMSTPPTRSLNPAIGTFTSFNLVDSLAKVTPKGGLFSTYTANGYDSWRNTVNPVSSTAYPSAHYIEFLADDTFDVKFRDNSGS
jgi:hypothetical protein